MSKISNVMASIAPSILAANFLNLEKDIEFVNNSPVSHLHIDIMDGVFVPNISFGQNITKQMASKCTKIIDVHLMIVNPEKYISEFRDAGADIISIHAEASNHLHRAIYQIKETGAKAGIALNPHTSISTVQNILEDVDVIVLMSVNPGFGGQKFIYNTIKKIEQLNELRAIHNYSFEIEIDGGVGLQNAEILLKAGANILVAGSSIFKADDPMLAATRLNDLASHF